MKLGNINNEINKSDLSLIIQEIEWMGVNVSRFILSIPFHFVIVDGVSSEVHVAYSLDSEDDIRQVLFIHHA